MSEPPVTDAADTLRCSFCHKRRDEVRSLICGQTPQIAICDECVALCSEIIAEQLSPVEPPPPSAA